MKGITYSRDKQVQALVSNYIRQGWRYAPGKKHGKLVAPNGRKAPIPFTPSDWRAVKNFRCQLKKQSSLT